MKASLENLVVEESPATEDAELQTARPDEQAARAIHQQRTVATESETFLKGQKSDSTEQSITKLISQSSEPHQEASGEDVLSEIANDFKLDNKKGPAVNQHLAKIVQGLMREKLSEEVLTETQNRYNRPENCDCLSTTKVSHLIGDKLKPETRSNDIKLQRVQSTLVKGVTPMVSIVEAR